MATSAATSALDDLERDVGELLAAYVAKVTPAADVAAAPSRAQPPTSALTFAALRELWIERHLSLLHHAKPNGVYVEDYTQTLFSIALGACPPLHPMQAKRCERGLATETHQRRTSTDPRVCGVYGSLSLTHTRALRDNTAKTHSAATA